jgi:hypothetical protein
MMVAVLFTPGRAESGPRARLSARASKTSRAASSRRTSGRITRRSPGSSSATSAPWASSLGLDALRRGWPGDRRSDRDRRHKVHANANRDRSMDYEDIARTIVDEAIATDAAETAEFR